MQRVSAFLPTTREKRHSKSSSKSVRSWWSHRASGSLHRLSVASGPTHSAAASLSHGMRAQHEAFWPSTLDIECERAARILNSFCGDGFLAMPADILQQQQSFPTTPEEPQTPVKTAHKIPPRILQNAAGIAIFTCMRNGLWLTGSGGSGILIARKSDGTWSPPSGIMLHTPALSFIIGVDIYDCVLVINSHATLEIITRPRVSLGDEVELDGGPLVGLQTTGSDMRWEHRSDAVLTYVKARGQHRDVNLHGSILTERSNENERFYHTGISQVQILAGNVDREVSETGPLFEVIKMAEGRSDFDSALIKKLALEPAPGDASIETPNATPVSPPSAFGLPNADDPDPYGILALEMAGLEIREAGTRLRPTSTQFEFHPPLAGFGHSNLNRQSVDTSMSRSNRGSYMSTHTMRSQATDAGTQTGTGSTAETTPNPSFSDVTAERYTNERIAAVKEEEEEDEGEDDEDYNYAAVDMDAMERISPRESTSHDASALGLEHDQTALDLPRSDTDLRKSSRASSLYERDDEEDDYHDDDSNNDYRHSQLDDDDDAAGETDDADDEDDDVDYDDEEPIVFEVAAVQPARTQNVASKMIQAKGSMVTIPKRIAPPLPSRNPGRLSRATKSDVSSGTAGIEAIRSLSRASLNGGYLSTGENSTNDQHTDMSAALRPTSVASTSHSAHIADAEQDDRASQSDRVSELTQMEAQTNHSFRTFRTFQQFEDHSDSDPHRVSKLLGLPVQKQGTASSDQASDAIREQESVDGSVEASHTEEHQEKVASGEGSGSHALGMKTSGPILTQLKIPEPLVVDSSDDDASLKTTDRDNSDDSDVNSNPEHDLSIVTGMTEDRWSYDGSSMTTPVSEKPGVADHELTGDNTPTKSAADGDKLSPLSEEHDAGNTHMPDGNHASAAKACEA